MVSKSKKVSVTWPSLCSLMPPELLLRMVWWIRWNHFACRYSASQLHDLWMVGVIFRPYGWKSSVTIRYFPSVRKFTVKFRYFPSVRMGINCNNSLFSVRTDGHLQLNFAIFRPYDIDSPDGATLLSKVLAQTASGKMRICGLADFQTCKMRIFLRTWLVKCGCGRNIIS